VVVDIHVSPGLRLLISFDDFFVSLSVLTTFMTELSDLMVKSDTKMEEIGQNR
jgi:hypothetical protein